MPLRSPPSKLISTIPTQNLKNVTYIKINRNSTKVIIATSQKQSKIISLWKLDKNKK
jgi:hypothetical protein